MKKIKIIMTCVLILTLLSGCSYISKVTMNYDGSVKEEVTILDSNSAFEGATNNTKDIIENKISNYYSVINYRNYKYDIIVGKKESGAKIYKTYNNICSYFQDTAFNQYIYQHIKCTEDEEYYIIKNDTDYIQYCSDCSDVPVLNDVSLEIVLPVSASEDNADEKEGNIYTWKFGENTKSDKSIYLKINKNTLEENKADTIKKNNTKAKVKTGFIIGLVIAIVTVLIIVGNTFYKKYKNNKIDY